MQRNVGERSWKWEIIGHFKLAEIEHERAFERQWDKLYKDQNTNNFVYSAAQVSWDPHEHIGKANNF